MDTFLGGDSHVYYKSSAPTPSRVFSSHLNILFAITIDLQTILVLFLSVASLGAITLLYYSISLFSLFYRIFIPGINVALPILSSNSTDQTIPQGRPPSICNNHRSNLRNRKIIRLCPCKTSLQLDSRISLSHKTSILTI